MLLIDESIQKERRRERESKPKREPEFNQVEKIWLNSLSLTEQISRQTNQPASQPPSLWITSSDDDERRRRRRKKTENKKIPADFFPALLSIFCISWAVVWLGSVRLSVCCAVVLFWVRLFFFSFFWKRKKAGKFWFGFSDRPDLRKNEVRRKKDWSLREKAVLFSGFGFCVF